MSAHIERHYSLYTTGQLFDLVADVEKYPQFLPWILSSRILRREQNAVWVEMILGIGPLQQHFNSQAVLHRPHTIEITSSDAPFHWFRQQWQFTTDHEGRTVVGYSYDFSLRSQILDLIPPAVLDQAVRATLDAFEQRARQVYGAQAALGVAQNASAPAARCADAGHS
ncbi:MAG TPA: type II toxin-antitoxin system RatA family toxin [Burkholderiales bacterium]